MKNEHLIKTFKFGALYLCFALPISYFFYGKHTNFNLDSTLDFIQLAVPSIVLYFFILLSFSHAKFKIRNRTKKNENNK